MNMFINLSAGDGEQADDSLNVTTEGDTSQELDESSQDVEVILLFLLTRIFCILCIVLIVICIVTLSKHTKLKENW